MANEAVLVMETEQAYNYSCADGTGIEKGTVCKLTTGNVAVASAANNDIIAGIVKTEKIASDGIASVSIYRKGRFRMLCHGTISAGHPVVSNGTNGVILATTNQENILGYMLEDATEGQTKLVELNPTVMQLA